MLRTIFVSSLLLCVGWAFAESSSEEVFTHIYDKGVWGLNAQGEGTSGGGSTASMTESYRIFLQQFLKDYAIQSVVDLGCGDWEFSQFIDWNGITYTGYDVVKSVIERNQKKFQQPSISFVHADILQALLPEADLLICKDVLQHLTNEDVALFIQKLSQFKYCLITNDVDPTTKSSSNPEILKGQYRYLDLTQHPFYVDGVKIFTYYAGPWMKQVLLIQNRQE
jgi:SAM-dependent methyltransferase